MCPQDGLLLHMVDPKCDFCGVVIPWMCDDNCGGGAETLCYLDGTPRPACYGCAMGNADLVDIDEKPTGPSDKRGSAQ